MQLRQKQPLLTNIPPTNIHLGFKMDKTFETNNTKLTITRY